MKVNGDGLELRSKSSTLTSAGSTDKAGSAIPVYVSHLVPPIFPQLLINTVFSEVSSKSSVVGFSDQHFSPTGR